MSDKNYHQLVEQLVTAAQGLNAEQRRGFLDDACEHLPEDIRARIEAELGRQTELGVATNEGLPTDPDATEASDAGEGWVLGPIGVNPLEDDSQKSDPTAVTEALPSDSGLGSPGPHLASESDKTVVDPGTRRDESRLGSDPATQTAERMRFDLPRKIGRYQAERIIGQGGFGFVFLARDSQLDRMIALKVPDPNCVESGWDLENYIVEARTVAQLDHPHIVPVYDVGEDPDFGFFIVSKYIDGSSLKMLADDHELSHLEAAELVAKVALAIHYAHTQGLVHRDIKPANILIGPRGEPYVTDFGIALREDDLGLGPRYTGSPPYMSPEQAAGEGHRVDGRSDVFGLGVVLYELLTGKRPFRADSKRALFKQIMTIDPKPMRQIDDAIPKPLERICAKALAKRASDRYTTAKDLANDLLAVLREQAGVSTHDGTTVRSSSDLEAGTTPNPTDTGGLQVGTDGASTGQLTAAVAQLRIVPKGMRSFDNRDADFFLQLLPGPRDRFGLPDSIRFWKTQIEQTDPSETFSVGLIYGPSGCGKSSLVKAGLLPRLDSHVESIYLEATPSDTEERILRAIRRQFPSLPDQLDLVETMKQLRLGEVLPKGQKLVIVLDQFEQWLHSNDVEQATLVAAMRQCRADRVQCIVMVRDDFWMAATSFMRQLEVRLVEDHNSNAVELFPLRHAKRVLTAFGRAYGALPPEGAISEAQQAFIDAAVDGISEDGKVVCVRLALLSEMMRHKVWTPQSLKDVGGLAGLGETYLDEMFMAPSAAPERRFHQVAARAVLKALLPDSSGSDIKRRKSYDDLLEISGYAKRRDDFEQLIDILDRQLRLITPTDQVLEQVESDVAQKTSTRSYQLSHDFLVPSVRAWLTRKQRETRRGRAEIRLQELASDWSVCPENRRLPTLVEWLSIRSMTTKRKWSRDERTMMTAATRYYGLRLAGSLLIACGIIGYLASSAHRNRERSAIALSQSLLTAPAKAVPYAIESLEPLAPYAVSYLKQQAADTSLPRNQRLHAMCALAKFAQVDIDEVVRLIPVLKGEESPNLVLALKAAGDESLPPVLSLVESSDRRQDWERKARYAIVACHLGDPQPITEMFQLSRPNPTQRTVLINELSVWNGGLLNLAAQAGPIQDPSAQSGLLLGVASWEVDTIEPGEIVAWQDRMNGWLNSDHSTVHAAAEWGLRRWNLPIPEVEASNQIRPPRTWTQTTSGLTLIRIPSPKLEFVATNRQKVNHGFLIADREISRALFEQFIKDTEYDGARPKAWKNLFARISPTGDHPAQGLNWYDAMMFCNWLSFREGRSPCYELNDGKWTPRPGANGYRLPTIAEWEYACRAGTATSFNFSDQAKWISMFGVSRVSFEVAQPAGSLLPNNWGIFDLHGNVWEWCLDRSDVNPEARLHKGGAYNCSADDCLIAKSYQSHARGGRKPFLGMRVIIATDVDPPTVE